MFRCAKHQERGMKMSNFYNPNPVEQGYYYHVAIQEQAQLTYEQYLIEKNREKTIRTSALMMIRVMKKSIGIMIRKHFLLTKNWTIW